MTDDWGKRETLLKVGANYRVRRNAPAFPGPSFKIGERVLLRHLGYSRYDEAYFYTFEAEGGVEKSFLLGDPEPISRLSEVFADENA